MNELLKMCIISGICNEQTIALFLKSYIGGYKFFLHENIYFIPADRSGAFIGRI